MIKSGSVSEGRKCLFMRVAFCFGEYNYATMLLEESVHLFMHVYKYSTSVRGDSSILDPLSSILCLSFLLPLLCMHEAAMHHRPSPHYLQTTVQKTLRHGIYFDSQLRRHLHVHVHVRFICSILIDFTPCFHADASHQCTRNTITRSSYDIGAKL